VVLATYWTWESQEKSPPPERSQNGNKKKKKVGDVEIGKKKGSKKKSQRNKKENKEKKIPNFWQNPEGRTKGGIWVVTGGGQGETPLRNHLGERIARVGGGAK